MIGKQAGNSCRPGKADRLRARALREKAVSFQGVELGTLFALFAARPHSMGSIG
jgi:hypothetical protein